MSDLWECPKCRATLQKGAPWMAEVVRTGGSISGSATCGNCQSAFSQQDVYSGRYDLGRPKIGRHSGGAPQDKKWWQFWR